MLARLKDLFATAAGAMPGAGSGVGGGDPVATAAAGLLVEAARMDGTFDAEERATVERLLAERFGLAPTAATALVETAARQMEESLELYSITRRLKDGLTYDERVQLVEMLWEVAYADGVLHDYEAGLLRRVSGLLYVEDADSGAARKRVLARRGLDG